MSSPCVLVVGNLTDGFRFIGPFADFDAAAQFSEGVDTDNWVATLEAPEPENALLSAAPELLAACKLAVRWLKHMTNDVDAETDLIDIQEAIAKAEGGTE